MMLEDPKGCGKMLTRNIAAISSNGPAMQGKLLCV
jgi:hypothetical protein